jgi:hypothetical protein
VSVTLFQCSLEIADSLFDDELDGIPQSEKQLPGGNMKDTFVGKGDQERRQG